MAINDQNLPLNGSATSPDLAVKFAGLTLKNPVLTASGTCGYVNELDEFTDINKLGGFITKSITPALRPGNPSPRIVEVNSGMLNAIGLANIGLERFVDEKIPLMRKYNLPFIVNIAGWNIDDYVKVAGKLAKYDEIAGFELNISCPNVKKGGIAFGTDPELIRQITTQVKAASQKKPLIVKLTPTVTDISVTAEAAIEAGADGISLVNTFTAMVIDIKTKKPVLANRTGGLSGPGIKPVAVYLVNKVYNEVTKDAGVPILGLGGIRTAEDVIEFMIAGATAVSVGTAVFAKPNCCQVIVDGLKKYCIDNGIESISSLTGSLQ